MSRLARLLAIFIMAGAVSSTAVHGSQIVNIKQAWSRATPKGSPVAAGYLTIENQGGLPDRLVEVHSAFARKVEVHTTTVENGVTSMKPVDGGLVIPANSSVTLQPGGNHLMFVGINAPLAEGEQVTVELFFEKAGKITASLEVAALGSLKPPAVQQSPGSGKAEAAPALEKLENSFFTHLCGEKLMANVTVTPARVGDFEVFVELENAEEQPLAAEAVSITLSDEKNRSQSVTANAERVSNEKWRVKLSAPTSGAWLLALNVKIPSADNVEIAAPILIE
jgi:periplasmic copper chaperone A